MVATAEQVWSHAELLLKVKEPVAAEYSRMRDGQIIFTFLHLAADAPLARALCARNVTAIAYETVELPDGSLPLLTPMSEVAGRLAPQVGAQALLRVNGGRGALLGGVPGTSPADVLILGGGVAGSHAAAIAVGMHADVVIVDRSIARLRQLDALYKGRVRTVASNTYEITRLCADADLVIGAVLVAGAAAPKLISSEMVRQMKPGSVLVDIAIDQGGCFEDSRPTTHDDPTYVVHQSVFYCVANMPGAVPNTSTFALTNATLPYILAVADRGWQQAMSDDPALASGLNVHAGSVTHPAVARALGPRVEGRR